MTRRSPVATAQTQFDEFLYAPIGEESNGALLSVLSALGRRNVDPGDEASRLAQLPPEAATHFLTALIAALPVGICGRHRRADPCEAAERVTATVDLGHLVSHPLPDLR